MTAEMKRQEAINESWKRMYELDDEMLETVRRVAGDDREFCNACFSGNYPTGDITEEMLADIEADRIASANAPSPASTN